MGYDRNPRGTGWRGDEYQRQGGGGDYGAGRTSDYSSAREYQAADDRDDDRYDQRGGYGGQRYGGGYDRGRSQGGEYHGSYASDGHRFTEAGDRDWDDRQDRDRGYGRGDYGRSSYGQGGYGERGEDRPSYGQRDYGRSGYGQSDYGQSRYQQGGQGDWSGGRDERGYDRGDRDRSYGRAPQGYDYQDRGFLSRAGDEVRSWFGDEDAERRREADSRYDERQYNQRGSHDRDSDYHSWRSGQIAALDRDYDEYRRENRSKFENEFSSWRTNRQTQRDSLNQVKEHAEVVGSDGSHVGTVDKVRGDRILLTKNDADAGGQHHSIPSSWISSVDEKKVTLSKSADEAKKHWRDEESNQAMFGYGDKTSGNKGSDDGEGRTNLNRSFSGTY